MVGWEPSANSMAFQFFPGELPWGGPTTSGGNAMKEAERTPASWYSNPERHNLPRESYFGPYSLAQLQPTIALYPYANEDELNLGPERWGQADLVIAPRTWRTSQVFSVTSEEDAPPPPTESQSTPLIVLAGSPILQLSSQILGAIGGFLYSPPVAAPQAVPLFRRNRGLPVGRAREIDRSTGFAGSPLTPQAAPELQPRPLVVLAESIRPLSRDIYRAVGFLGSGPEFLVTESWRPLTSGVAQPFVPAARRITSSFLGPAPAAAPQQVPSPEALWRLNRWTYVPPARSLGPFGFLGGSDFPPPPPQIYLPQPLIRRATVPLVFFDTHTFIGMVPGTTPPFAPVAGQYAFAFIG